MLSVGNLKLGDGMPKICASITEEDKKSVLASADIMIQKRVDLVEWRLDYFKDLDDPAIMDETLKRLHKALGKMPLVVTYRTENEGGLGKYSVEEYRELLLNISKSEFVDIVDFEVFNDRNSSDDIKDFIENGNISNDAFDFISRLRENALVIGSYHNFDSTPDRITIEAILKIQDLLECDILKIAVMPGNDADVVALINAVNEVYVHGTKRPIIAMSMGGIGAVSRIIGETFGSAVTFASVGQASAPGQIEAMRLRGMLENLHSLRI
ncbi:MAG: type I 3-dehydroquinate dehydratase [Lachnospiraceae bacterium]|nr:type I 3-dehydroquinate dehydratase [Lachnospiraceae bacterium]